jgi:esterase/lipase superfamily enzyme
MLTKSSISARRYKALAGVGALILAWVMTTQSAASGQTTQSEAPSVETLGKRKMELERQVQQIGSADNPANSPQLRSLQEQLLEVTGEEDEALQRPPDSAKAFNNITSYMAVPVYYVTDRARTKRGSFGAELRSQGVEYGISTVTLGLSDGVRVDQIAGARNLPRGTGTSSPAIQSVNGEHELLDAIELNKTDPRGRRRRVILFVHGYNVKFPDAINAAARLSTELQFPVIPVAYSWPSEGSYAGYWHDEDTVRSSSLRFMAFLQTLLTKSPAEVVIVCHSMGAREVAASLAELGRRGVKLPAQHKVIFAAGDISSQEFANLWPDIQRLDGVQFGFYASNHDLALRLSHIVHGLARLGDASPTIFAPSGGMTVDASSVDSVFQAAGHSYILNSSKIGADMGMWIDGGASPAVRGLREVTRSGQRYYLFP